MYQALIVHDNEGPGETSQMRRLHWALTDRIYMYEYMNWLIIRLSGRL